MMTQDEPDGILGCERAARDEEAAPFPQSKSVVFPGFRVWGGLFTGV